MTFFDISDRLGVLCIQCDSRPELDFLKHSEEPDDYRFSFFVSSSLFVRDGMVTFRFGFLIGMAHDFASSKQRRQLQEKTYDMQLGFDWVESANTASTKELPKEQLRSKLAVHQAKSARAQAKVQAFQQQSFATQREAQITVKSSSYSTVKLNGTSFEIDVRVIYGFAVLGLISLSYFGLRRVLKKQSYTVITEVDEEI